MQAPKKNAAGEDNRGFAIEVPAVFSNAEGPFTVTEAEHEKYRNRIKHYAKQSTSER